MKRETLDHQRLKLLGRRILLNMGFPSSNIKEEYRLVVNEKQYIADLWAGGEKYQVVVECGNAHADKIARLRDVGIVVIHLPFSEFKDAGAITEEEAAIIKQFTERLGKLMVSVKDVELETSNLRNRAALVWEDHIKTLTTCRGQYEDELKQLQTLVISLQTSIQLICELPKMLKSLGEAFNMSSQLLNDKVRSIGYPQPRGVEDADHQKWAQGSEYLKTERP